MSNTESRAKTRRWYVGSHVDSVRLRYPRGDGRTYADDPDFDTELEARQFVLVRANQKFRSAEIELNRARLRVKKADKLLAAMRAGETKP